MLKTLRALSIPHYPRCGNNKMKSKIGIALGIMIGLTIYEFFKLGMEGMDWFRPPYVAVIAFVLMLLVPNKYLEKKEK